MKTVYADITTFEGKNTVIAHVCNDRGLWGAGVSGAIGNRWPEAEKEYRFWSYHRNDEELLKDFYLPSFSLGNISYVRVDSANNVHVCNMIAQKGVRNSENQKPLDMQALQKCLFKLAEDAKFDGNDVIMPKIGAGLGGGDWDEIRIMIENIFDSYGVNVTIYDWSPS